ncbi:hypothetical protein RBH26_20660 [Natronolimnohabitans sp. A-GB9]|uniref:hypothetical protein n=1 Tax=Natronolimnohabitans sp. A-GB9 TaxID=3069757 RepID=UPI0027B4CA10|nr:hypothetical protein [Natronolimnohabitans sp. A-GB9]MDQ2052857.1 hypothetical protein [Natronolimnohabitans sp. A-GB9]
MRQFNAIPFDTRESDRRGYETFKEEIWRSSEVCNSCFSQVRSIGPEKHKMLSTPEEKRLEHGGPPPILTLYEWYERTENGSQEHTPWDSNRRFGTCFCENCGTDCNGNHRNKSLEELKPLAANIYRYVSLKTDYELDPQRFGAVVRELKQLRSAQGNETEILAIAFARSLGQEKAIVDTAQSTRAAVASD